jgi:hypothetical protein
MYQTSAGGVSLNANGDTRLFVTAFKSTASTGPTLQPEKKILSRLLGQRMKKGAKGCSASICG